MKLFLGLALALSCFTLIPAQAISKLIPSSTINCSGDDHGDDEGEE